MDKTSELMEILGETFTWNKSRLECFVNMLMSLFVVRTINLREMATAFISPAQIDSRYKRLKRFFSEFSIDTTSVARWMFHLFFKDNEKVYLTIDRTNWFWGRSKINLLILGVAYEGISIPLFWCLLNKAGNATAQEHIFMLKRFIMTFGKSRIAGVLADREFGSEEFFGWMNNRRIAFYIRVKENTQVRISKKKLMKAGRLCKGLMPYQQQTFGMKVEIFGERVYLCASKNERGELLIVATNGKAKMGISIYLRRWEIETLFQSLKSRGFRFEDTHMTKAERIEKLMVLLSVGFCWAHKVGEWRATIKPIRFNKYRNGYRPQYSYFRYGFDLIRDVITKIWCMRRQLKYCIRQLIIPNSISMEVVS